MKSGDTVVERQVHVGRWTGRMDESIRQQNMENDGNCHGNRPRRSRAKLAHYPSAPCCMLSREHCNSRHVTAPHGKGRAENILYKSRFDDQSACCWFRLLICDIAPLSQSFFKLPPWCFISVGFTGKTLLVHFTFCSEKNLRKNWVTSTI